MKLEFNSLEEACEFAYEVRFKALLGAQSASKQVEKFSVTEKEAGTKTAKAKAEKKEDPVQQEDEPSQPDQEREGQEAAYTLVDVRAKLTELSRGGKAKEVKKLLTDAGASNVSSLDPSKYGEVMEKAGEL